jgi:hypothetical protein
MPNSPAAFAETFASYVRAAEKWTDSGLKGVQSLLRDLSSNLHLDVRAPSCGLPRLGLIRSVPHKTGRTGHNAKSHDEQGNSGAWTPTTTSP